MTKYTFYKASLHATFNEYKKKQKTCHRQNMTKTNLIIKTADKNLKWYKDGRHKKVSAIFCYVKIKNKGVGEMGRPKGGKNKYHS